MGAPDNEATALTIAQRTVAVVGRLASMSWQDAAAKVAAAGGTLRRGLSRRTDVVVVGRRAHELVANRRLDRRLAQVARSRTQVVSEGALLRAIGMAPALSHIDRPFTLANIAAQTQMALDTVETLALFDVIESDEAGRCAFRDLVAARAVARRLNEGASLAEILAGALHAAGPGLHGDAAHIVATIERGQLHLPLADSNPDADDLFESAYAAEEDGDLTRAKALYQRCLHADRRDPTAPFNLANVLVALGQPPRARLHYELALSVDPKFVEARYNLAHQLEAAGDVAGAKTQLLAALKTDARYADAWFNLATLHTRDGDMAAAIRAWEKYLVLDPSGDWAEKARQSLTLCRRMARAEGSA